MLKIQIGDSDKVLSMDEDLFGAACIIAAALFYYGLKENALAFSLEDISNSDLIDELITSSEGRKVDRYWVTHELTTVENYQDYDLGIDTGVFPNYQEDIKWDPLLGNLMGAYHGLYALSTQFYDGRKSSKIYCTAGQAVDISSLFDYVMGEIKIVKCKEVVKAIQDLNQLFATTARSRSVVVITSGDDLNE